MFNVLERITELRLSHGWSVYRLSKESSIPQSTIATWYQKNLCPPLEKIERICSSMSISLNDFFSTDQQITLTPETKDLLDRWANLSLEQKKCVSDVIDTMLRPNTMH